MGAKNKREKQKKCRGKRAYATLAEAQDVAKYHNKRGGEWMLPYKCDFCGNYHTGHAPGHVRKKILMRKAKPWKPAQDSTTAAT